MRSIHLRIMFDISSLFSPKPNNALSVKELMCFFDCSYTDSVKRVDLDEVNLESSFFFIVFCFLHFGVSTEVLFISFD